MIPDSFLPAFTLFHVLISLAAILTGLIVLLLWIKNKSHRPLTSFFLLTTAATTLTGFLFPLKGLTPAVTLGIISTLLLIPTLYLHHTHHSKRISQILFILGSAIALYLNTLVLIVQSFQKIPPLHSFAPTQSEPPFLITQITVMLLFILLTIFALKNYKPLPKN